MNRSQLKLAAAVGIVVIALSGFSPTKRGGTDGDGGGCSKDSSSTSSGGSSGGTGTTNSRPQPTGRVTECAGTGADPAATVSVTAPASRSGTYTVRVSFLDSTGVVVGHGEQRTPQIPAGESRTLQVPVSGSMPVEDVAECRLDSVR